MKTKAFILSILVLVSSLVDAQPAYLKNVGGTQRLMVNGKPFIMIAGELHNSTSSTYEYLSTTWASLRAMHLNSVIATVAWEQLEPEEGKFDFEMVDSIISLATRYQMPTAIARFGTWKNSESSYAPGDKADKPLFSVCKANYPQTNINELLTKENMRQKHTLSMRVETSNLSFQIDGTGLIAQPYEAPFYFKLMGMEADSASPLAVGQYGNTHDFNSFPNLCNIGFAAMPESKVVLSDYSITNRGRSEDNVVFAQEQYDRFNQIPCTRVEGKNIIIDNPGKTMRMGYVDPSHGALTMVRSDFKTAKFQLLGRPRGIESKTGYQLSGRIA